MTTRRLSEPFEPFHGRMRTVTVAFLLLTVGLAPALASGGAQAGTTAMDPTRVGPLLADRLEGPSTGSQLEAIVMMSQDVTAETIEAAHEHGLSTMPPLPALPSVFAIRGAPADVDAFIHTEEVEFAQWNRPIDYALDTSRTALGVESVTDHLPGRGGPMTVGGQVVDGSGVGVAIVDSGIDGTHPDLEYGDQVARNKKFVCSTPGLVHPDDGDDQADDPQDRYCFGNWFLQNPPDPTSDDLFPEGACEAADADPLWIEAPQTDTSSGHGTHVASTAAGSGAGSPAPGLFRGVAPGATLYGFSMGEGGALITAFHAFSWIICNNDELDDPIKVVNNSWGSFSGTCSRTHVPGITSRLIDEMVAQDITVVFAAGNSGGDGSNPCTSDDASVDIPGVVMVANYDDAQIGTIRGDLASSSSRGDADNATTWPDVSAPGTGITAAKAKNVGTSTAIGTFLFEERDPAEYMAISGTSMAAPHVTGAVALLNQAHPGITPAEVEDVLEDTAIEYDNGVPYEDDPNNIDGVGQSSYDKGHGLVDVRAALEELEATESSVSLGDTAPSQAALTSGTFYLRTGPNGVGNLDADHFGWEKGFPTKTTPSVWREPVLLTNDDTFWIPAKILNGAVDLDTADVSVDFWFNTAPFTSVGVPKWDVTLTVGDTVETQTVSVPLTATGPTKGSVTFEDVTAEDRGMKIVFDSTFVDTNSDNVLLYDSVDTPTSLKIS